MTAHIRDACERINGLACQYPACSCTPHDELRVPFRGVNLDFILLMLRRAEEDGVAVRVRLTSTAPSRYSGEITRKPYGDDQTPAG